jgi:hypothetical protein
MDASGEFALCDSCGMKHTRDRIKAMAQEVTGTVAVSNLAGIESLMKRGNLALEDSDWHKADGFFDKVLDIDAEYAPAYVGKLCAGISMVNMNWVKNDSFAYVIKMEPDLARYYKPFDDMPNYQKAIRFADETYRAQLEEYNSAIKKRVEELKKEFAFYMIIEHAYHNTYDITTSINGICHIGSLRDGWRIEILRTGFEYVIRKEDKYKSCKVHTKGSYDIEPGDVAAITHEMFEKELRREEEHKKKQERWQEEQKQREENERNAQKLKKEAEERERERQAKEYEIRRIKDKKKRLFWGIFSILLGGIIGGSLFAFLASVAGAKDFILWFSIVGGILAGLWKWMFGGKLVNGCGFGCGGIIICAIFAAIIVEVAPKIPFMVSIAIGVGLGACLGIWNALRTK